MVGTLFHGFLWKCLNLTFLNELFSYSHCSHFCLWFLWLPKWQRSDVSSSRIVPFFQNLHKSNVLLWNISLLLINTWNCLEIIPANDPTKRITCNKHCHATLCHHCTSHGALTKLKSTNYQHMRIVWILEKPFCRWLVKNKQQFFYKNSNLMLPLQ